MNVIDAMLTRSAAVAEAAVVEEMYWAALAPLASIQATTLADSRLDSNGHVLAACLHSGCYCCW